MASGCAKGGSGLAAGRIVSQKRLLNIGMCRVTQCHGLVDMRVFCQKLSSVISGVFSNPVDSVILRYFSYNLRVCSALCMK